VQLIIIVASRISGGASSAAREGAGLLNPESFLLSADEVIE
jgi:hypothetical protein